MEVKKTLKYCKIFENFDEKFVRSIERACVFFKNEAFVVDNNDDVFYLVNNRKYKVDFLCGKNVQNIVYSYLPSSNDYHMMARTFDNKIFSWGRNTFDQVCKSSEYEVYIPKRKRLYYGGFDKIRLSFSDHFYRLSETQIWNSCGLPSIWNYLGALFEPCKEFAMMACGATHSMAVTVDNRIVLWGGNMFGQIGDGTINTTQTQTTFEILVKKVNYKEYPPLNSCECAKSVACASTGLIGGISCCVHCPLGLFALPCSFCFFCCCNCTKRERVIIHEEVPVQTIACGSFHNLVLFENKRLWGWGSNNLGQLGRFPINCIVKPVPIFDHVVAIATFNSHTLVLCEDGVLHGMGSNEYGQLGSYYKHFTLNDPQRFDLKFNEIATINSICVGKGKDGLFYAWGLYRLENFRRSEKVVDKSLQDGLAFIIDAKEPSKENEEGENVEKDKTVIRDVSRAYIIDQPKVVRCNSFNEFFGKQASLTYYTIDMINRQEEPVFNLPRASNITPVNQPELPLIDESELKIIEFIDREDMNQGHTNNNIRIGDNQKISMFDNCPINAETSVSNVKLTGKKSTMQSMRDYFQ